jgi:hypothetical protein
MSVIGQVPGLAGCAVDGDGADPVRVTPQRALRVVGAEDDYLVREGTAALRAEVDEACSGRWV